MELNAENNCRRDAIKEKLRQNFDGKIVRKDLTKKIKEGANVPVYVLEFLLGQYCSSDDEEIIEQGVQNVKHILADNFVRPDEAQKIPQGAPEGGLDIRGLLCSGGGRGAGTGNGSGNRGELLSACQ